MQVPYVVFLVLYAIGFIAGCFIHGKEMKGNRNAGASVFGSALKIGLLIWGGFFSHIAWPQVWIIVMVAIDAIGSILTDGRPFGRHHVLHTLIGLALTFIPLYCGGFFGQG
jgi:hypothetical protein